VLVRAVLAGCALSALVAAGPASAAPGDGPAGLRGTLSITHTFAVEPVKGIESHISDPTFKATYRLRGRRWTGRFATPRTYLLTGRGHESIDLFRRDVKSDGEGGQADLGFTATADGNVRLVRRPNEPRETTPLGLRLRPGGRFRLSLLSLEGGHEGLPLNFYMERNDSQSCHGSSGGNLRGKMIFFRGVFEVHEVEHCPDGESFPGSIRGRQRSPSIWGANIWNPPQGAFPRPNLCLGATTGNPNLTICGRHRGGRIAGRKVIGGRDGYVTAGICAFYPRGEGPRVLPDPIKEAYGQACTQMDLGGDWRRRTVVSWNLRPTR
jgi:hypothetical protein